MNTRITRSIFSLILLVALLAPAWALDQSQISSVLSEIDEAAQERDVQKIASFLSDSVVISMEVPTPQGIARIEIGKEEYLDILAQVWNATGRGYTYSRKSIDIAITNDGNRAQATSIVFEGAQVNGQVFSSESLEVADFAEENGEVVVVRIHASTYIKGSPVPKASI